MAIEHISGSNVDVTANDVIKDCLTEYGIHSHRTKITNVIDGLKPVNRRILLVQNSNEPRKVTAIVGSVMEKYHPYGDGAIGDAIIRMAQPFNTMINLMYSDSNVGNYTGAVAAAPRYLSVGASQFAIDVYIKGIDKNTFEYIPSETGEGIEPKFFVPKIPMALLVAHFGMGLAHKSEPATLNMQDVCKLVINYIKHSQIYGDKFTNEIKYSKLSKYTIPDFPIAVLLRNEKELLEQYSIGNFKTSLVVDGTLILTPNEIIIKTLPYGIKPKDVWETLGLLRKESKPNFVNSNFQRVEEYGKGFDETLIKVTLKRGVSPFAVLSKFKETIGFTKKWTPSYLYTTPSDKIEYLDPIKVVEYWYEERSRSIKAELRSGQRKNTDDIRRITALIKIGDNIEDVVKIARKCNTVEEVYPILEEKYGLSKGQAISIMQYKLQNIPKRSHSQLIDELNNIRIAQAELQNKFFNVDKQIVQDAEMFISKYDQYCSRRCNSIEFIGYIKIEDGVIQFSSIEEMIEILSTFSKHDKEIFIYPSGHKYHFLFDRNMFKDETDIILPKESKGSIIVASKNTIKYTLCLTDGTIFRINKLVYSDSKKIKYFHLTDKCVVIRKCGLVEELDPLEIPIRNNIESRGVNSDIIGISTFTNDEVIIVSSYENNNIIFERVRVGSKINILPKSVAKTTIIGVFNPNDIIAFTVPDCVLNKCSIKSVYIKDPSIINDKLIIKLSSKLIRDISIKTYYDAGLMMVGEIK
jgi:DNA gyrase/topoisomerase IV subunit A